MIHGKKHFTITRHHFWVYSICVIFKQKECPTNIKVMHGMAVSMGEIPLEDSKLMEAKLPQFMDDLENQGSDWEVVSHSIVGNPATMQR